MTLNEYAIIAIPIALAMTGSWFLFREVGAGHEFEVLSRALDEIRELQAIYPLNPREYWVRHQMYGLELTRAKAVEMVGLFDEAQIQQAATEAYENMEEVSSASLERWRTSGAPNVLRRRKWLLRAGFLTLVGGLGITLLEETLKYLRG